MLKCIIVDDEKIAREGIAGLLSKDEEIEIVDLCADGSQAVESIIYFNPDVVFLDIQMPDLNGFEVLQAINNHVKPIIVFITAFDQFALKAFEASAFDYLLKPFDDDRFYEIITRVKKQVELVKSENYTQNLEQIIRKLAKSNEIPKKDEEGIPGKIMVKREGGVSFINTDDVIAIEASDYYLRIITANKEYIKRKTLSSIEEKLSKELFIRIHRSTIINVNYVKSIEKYTADEHIIFLENGKKYRISKSGKRKLKNRFLM